MNQKDFYYLLPTGETARDMKEGCEILSRQKGYKFGSNSFKHLVEKGVIKKIKFDNSVIAKCDAREANKPIETR